MEYTPTCEGGRTWPFLSRPLLAAEFGVEPILRTWREWRQPPPSFMGGWREHVLQSLA